MFDCLLKTRCKLQPLIKCECDAVGYRDSAKIAKNKGTVLERSRVFAQEASKVIPHQFIIEMKSV